MMTGSRPRMEVRLDPAGRMELGVIGEPAGHGAAVDFRRVSLAGISSQPLVRACGEPGQLLDATAGLGGDSWILAAAGFLVTAVERSPLVAAVLRDGIARARADGRLATIANRIELHVGESAAMLAASGTPWTAIYLDPMYPPKTKSALAPKPIRLVRDAVGDDLDARDLFLAAVAANPGRIVVKRPHHAAVVHPEPDLTFESKLARYDAYLRSGSSLRTLRPSPEKSL